MLKESNRKEKSGKKENLDLLSKAVTALEAIDSTDGLKSVKDKIYFGYIRVSTQDQNLDRQKSALESYAAINKFTFTKIFEDKATGINLDRPQLEILRNQLRDGDIIVVESYDRLCRSTLDLLKLIDEFEVKNVGFISIKENFNTMNAMGRLLLTVVAAVGEMERKLMLERQMIGVKKAQLEGKYKGRQPIKKPDNFDQCLDRYLSATKLKPYPFRKFLKDTNLKRSTLIKFINQAKLESLEKK